MDKIPAIITAHEGYTVIKFGKCVFYTKDQDEIEKLIKNHNLEVVIEANPFDFSEKVHDPI
jgi:hypothetical protein